MYPVWRFNDTNTAYHEKLSLRWAQSRNPVIKWRQDTSTRKYFNLQAKCTLCDASMTQIQLTMKNFPFAEQLNGIFERYSDDYEYTSNGIFRKIKPPLCTDCGTPMSHNGFNNHTKRLLGDVKIGKYLCPNCRKNIEEEHGFWENATSAFFGLFGGLCQLLRVNHVSLEVIEKVSNYIYPRTTNSSRL